MDQSLMERFLGPSTEFFLFNQNDVSVAPIDKKTCLLTKRNVIATTQATSAALAIINNCTKTNPGTKSDNASYSASKLKPYKGAKTQGNYGSYKITQQEADELTDSLLFGTDSADTPAVLETTTASAPKKKLSSSSYTILNKSGYLEAAPAAVVASSTNDATSDSRAANGNENEEDMGSSHSTYDKSEESEKIKSNEDSSLTSDSSDNENCKLKVVEATGNEVFFLCNVT